MTGLPPQPVAKTYRFLADCGHPYVIIGAVASSILGEPRFTSDLDTIVYIRPDNAPEFLKKIKTAGFEFDEQKSLFNIKNNFTFQATMDSLRVDFLIATTAFEMELLARSFVISVDNFSIRIPSPEDLILMKLLTHRDKDWVDLKSVAIRHRKKLDIAYIKQWAQTWHLTNNQSPILTLLDRLLQELKQISDLQS